MNEETGTEENPLAVVKEEAATHTQAAVSALIRALYAFILEGIIHGLLHGLEKFVTHEKFPVYVYRAIEYGGVFSLLLYVISRLWLHGLGTYVDTCLESRKALKRLRATPRNNAQPKNVIDSGHNENTDEN